MPHTVHPPSMRGLLAFESVVRHASFTKAAEELNITQGAVSHQIRKLESVLGATLFDRNGTGLTLTRFGRRYIEDIRPSLQKIVYATSHTMYEGDQTLSIAAPATFSTFYLAPRLARFRDLFDHLNIELTSSFVPQDVGLLKSDVTIFFGRKEHGVGVIEEIFCARRYPTCSTSYRDMLLLNDRSNYGHAYLIHQAYRPQIWPDWFRYYGLDYQDSGRGMLIDQMTTAKQAVLADTGVAMIPRYAIERELKDGTLFCHEDMPVIDDMRYYACYRERGPNTRVIQQFIEFMRSTSQQDLL